VNAVERIATLEAELAALKAELIKPAEVKPWEPKGGKWALFTGGRVYGPNESDARHRLAGSEYPTREAAESALPYVTFFKRLACLAAELNPSGRVGGEWRVFTSSPLGKWVANSSPVQHRDIADIFETREVALRAAEIMNRDGWKVPALPDQGGAK